MAIADMNWIMGLSLMFALALIFSYLTYKDVETFFVFLTIFCGFMVWSGLVPLWVLIMCVIVLVLIIINNVNKRRIG